MYHSKTIRKARYNIAINVMFFGSKRGKGFGFRRKTLLRSGPTVWSCEIWDSHAENLIQTRTELLLGVY